MLIVEYEDLTASWDAQGFEWKSDEEVFADALNDNLPKFPVEAHLLVGGVEGLALEGAKKVFGGDLKVILFDPPLPDPPEEGTDDT